MDKKYEEFSKTERAKKILTRVFAAFYLIAAIWTFGHCWNRLSSRHPNAASANIVTAPFCAAFWPLYWSVILQEDEK